MIENEQDSIQPAANATSDRLQHGAWGHALPALGHLNAVRTDELRASTHEQAHEQAHIQSVQTARAARTAVRLPRRAQHALACPCPQPRERGLERCRARRRKCVGAQVQRRSLERRAEDIWHVRKDDVDEQQAEQGRPDAGLAVDAAPSAVLRQREVLEHEVLDDDMCATIVADIPVGLGHVNTIERVASTCLDTV
jgi:hypothetical protein